MKNITYTFALILFAFLFNISALSAQNVGVFCPDSGCGGDGSLGVVSGVYIPTGNTVGTQPEYTGPGTSNAYRLFCFEDTPFPGFTVYQWKIAQTSSPNDAVYFGPIEFGASIPYTDSSNGGWNATDNSHNPSPENAAILPVELTNFSGELLNKSIALQWQTVLETNNEGFEIERSKDGRAWDYLDFVNGQGESNEIINYEFLDQRPVAGQNYYRLRQLDFDGQFSYSNVISVEFERQVFEVFPNPIKSGSVLNFRLGNEDLVDAEMQVMDQTGRIMQVAGISSNQTSIQIPSLKQGIYYVSLIANDKIYRERIIVK